MPTNKPKPAAVAEANGAPEAKPEPQTFSSKQEQADTKPKERKVIYPDLQVSGATIDRSKLRLSVAVAKKVLGWETEAEWAARLKREDKTLAKLELKFALHDPPIEQMLTDENGDKVRCRNNRGNRPYEDATARQYSQDILNRKWRLNCETIIVGKTGMVESGQHRLVGLVLAAQMWAANKAKWQKLWTEEPWIESLIVFGAEEDPETIQTLDNVRTRTEADTIYTSPIFQDLSTNSERKECSRMLSNALGLLWKRTGAEETADKYKTHAAALDFLKRHPKLEECVREVFELNKERGISYHAKLSPGMAAGCLYLMGSSTSDVDDYRTASPHPSEKKLAWDRWDTALGFFKALIDKNDKKTRAIRTAVKDLYDEGNARAHEKLVILAKAWNLWAEDQPIRESDLQLNYKEDEERKVLLDDDCFGGIDLGQKPEKQDDDVGEEEAAKSKEEVDRERQELKRQQAEAAVQKVRESTLPQAQRQIGKDGKPLPTKLPKPVTRKQIEDGQTKAAREADKVTGPPKKVGGVIVNAGNKKSVK